MSQLEQKIESSRGSAQNQLSATAEALLGVVFDSLYQQVHAPIRDTLLHKIFDPRQDLTLAQAGRLAYQRSRVVHHNVRAPLEMLRNPQHLFALAEWPALLDISCFSLLMVHYNLCLGTLFDNGRDRPEIAEYVDELNSLAAFGPYMATELGYGNNVAALRTEATYDHETRSFVLNTPDRSAQKYMSYSGFEDIPKIAVVLARLKMAGADCGVFPFVVRLSSEAGLCAGIRAAACPEKPVQGLDNGLTHFEQVRIPARNILLGDMATITSDGKFKPLVVNSRARFLRSMSRIVPGRLCVASSAVAMGRASVYVALRYAMHRHTNAPGTNSMPVMEYRSHQLAMFIALARTYATTAFVNSVKRDYLSQQPSPSAHTLNRVNIAKATATWQMSNVVDTCRERCGAQGIFSVNRIVDYGLLLQGLVTAEGDNQVLLATTAGQMVAQPWNEKLPEACARGKRERSDVSWLCELMLVREWRLRTALLEARESAGRKSYFDLWNDSINTYVELARLHGIRGALESLHQAATAATDATASGALRLLASLFGLTEIQRDAGWYVASGLLDGADALALPAQLDALCVELKPHIAVLLEGFALSPELLRAPIAQRDYMRAFSDYALNQASPQVPCEVM